MIRLALAALLMASAAGPSLAQTPEACRIEAADHHPPLGLEHPLHLAQGGVRVGIQLEGMGKHNQIQAVRLEWESREIADQPHLDRRRCDCRQRAELTQWFSYC